MTNASVWLWIVYYLLARECFGACLSEERHVCRLEGWSCLRWPGAESCSQISWPRNVRTVGLETQLRHGKSDLVQLVIGWTENNMNSYWRTLALASPKTGGHRSGQEKELEGRAPIRSGVYFCTVLEARSSNLPDHDFCNKIGLDLCLNDLCQSLDIFFFI